ncbi:MAG TPA: tyrosine-protein phosphatase [Aggregatilineaceae bacterium]|nr:tyrosine-protein phosphatase [Aggregatilineaceae bacterium]
MTRERCLTWDGCTNVRDLGGLRTLDGRGTRWGAVVRSDHPARLTAAGWSALYEYGIRTIITLATDGNPEDMPDSAPRPSDLVTIRCAIEDFTDTEFVDLWVMNELCCTPLYYRDALKRWPERHIAVIKTIARARPGGVLIHCKRGHDRTGIVTLLLLALAGVDPSNILADYELSLDSERDILLAREQTTTRETIFTTLAQLDVEAYLRSGGLSQADLIAVRTRLLDPVEGSGIV